MLSFQFVFIEEIDDMYGVLIYFKWKVVIFDGSYRKKNIGMNNKLKKEKGKFFINKVLII